MGQESKVSNISEYFDTSIDKERDSKDYSGYQEFHGFDWSQIAPNYNSEPGDTHDLKRFQYLLDAEVEGESDMENFNRREFEEKMGRFEDKMNHQRDLDYQRYDNLASNLGTKISNSHDKLEASQSSFFEKFELKNEASITEIKNTNEKMINDFKQEFKKERKEDLRKTISFVLAGTTLIVTVAGFILNYFII